jgi:hypothetical protein
MSTMSWTSKYQFLCRPASAPMPDHNRDCWLVERKDLGPKETSWEPDNKKVSLQRIQNDQHPSGTENVRDTAPNAILDFLTQRNAP